VICILETPSSYLCLVTKYAGKVFWNRFGVQHYAIGTVESAIKGNNLLSNSLSIAGSWEKLWNERTQILIIIV
jgi:hypothetical protein